MNPFGPLQAPKATPPSFRHRVEFDYRNARYRVTEWNSGLLSLAIWSGGQWQQHNPTRTLATRARTALAAESARVKDPG